MLVYVSGKMSGTGDDFNYPAFDRAAARLRELGFDVLNPAETAGGITHLDREQFMQLDIGYVMAADAVVVMSEPWDWRTSKGAKFEIILADTLGKPVYLYDGDIGLGPRVRVHDWTVDHNLCIAPTPDRWPTRCQEAV